LKSLFFKQKRLSEIVYELFSRFFKSSILSVILALSTSSSCMVQAGGTPQRTDPDSYASCAGIGFGLGLIPVIGTGYTTVMAFILSTMSHTDKSECVNGLITGHGVGVATDVALLIALYKYKGAQAAGVAALLPMFLAAALLAQ
jgi:hypothetical protein